MEEYIFKSFPSLHQNQIAVIRAEKHSEFILNPDDSRHLGTGNPFLVFDSLFQALEYAGQQPCHLEVLMYNADGRVVEILEVDEGL